MWHNHDSYLIDAVRLRQQQRCCENEKRRLAALAAKATAPTTSLRRFSVRGIIRGMRPHADESAPASLAVDWEPQG